MQLRDPKLGKPLSRHSQCALIEATWYSFDAVSVASFDLFASGNCPHASARFLDLDLSIVEYLSDKSLLALAEMLNDLVSLKNLLLSFRGCKSITDSGVVAVVEGLPPVTLLKLDFAFLQISNETVDALAHRMQVMSELGVMHINLQGCQDISEASVGHLVQMLPSSLKGAKLNLCDTPLPMNIQKLCRRLTTMRKWPLKPSPAFAKESRAAPVVQESADVGTEKPGLALRSLDLFVRRGCVDPRPPARPEARTSQGRRDGWQEKVMSMMSMPYSDEEQRRLRRTFSEPYQRQFRALLPKVAHQAKGSSIAAMANPECMFSRPRTTHSGFSEPVWYP